MPNTTLREHLNAIISSAVSHAVDQSIAAYKLVLMSGLGGGAPTKSVAKSNGAPTTTPTATLVKAKRKKKFARRNPAELATTAATLLEFIQRSPGLRSEQIVKGIGGDAEALADGLKRLRASKKVTTKGNKRATTYWV